MRRTKSRVLALLLAAALCASLLPMSASAASAGVSSWTQNIGGSNATIVSVTMGTGRTGEISLANNSIVEAASPSALINQKNNRTGTHVTAAMNGGFFDSYSGRATVMDAVVNNGKLIHTGRSAMLGFTDGGKAMIDWVDFDSQVRLGNGSSISSGWGINTYQADPGAIMLFNEHMTLPVAIPAESTIVMIQNGKVAGIGMGGYSFTPAKGTDYLVYNYAAAAQYKEWGMFPEVGMSANMVLTASGTQRDADWAAVENALTGGPVLVKNGANVVSDARNQGFYADSKQKPDAVAARTFLAITWSGDLLMGVVPSSSFNRIADWLASTGNVMEAIAMDGGGSCMLYNDASGFLTSGRNLATALVIVDRANGNTQAAESNMGKPGTDTPASWAAADIQTAISLGLVPDILQKGYKDEITRQDFCLLIEKLARKDPDFITKLYSKPEVGGFTDTVKDELRWCAQMGVIEGYSDGSFKPYNTLTRAQAAKILALTVKFLSGQETSGAQYPFADRADFPGWDQGWIDFCGVNKVMNGKAGGVFDPGGTFTRQEAIATMLRVYNNYISK